MTVAAPDRSVGRRLLAFVRWLAAREDLPPAQDRDHTGIAGRGWGRKLLQSEPLPPPPPPTRGGKEPGLGWRWLLASEELPAPPPAAATTGSRLGVLRWLFGSERLPDADHGRPIGEERDGERP